LQAKTVPQARTMLRETPASPQTAFISDPFSAKRKLQSPQRKFEVKNKFKNNGNVKINPATGFAFVGRHLKRSAVRRTSSMQEPY
jgi:hypothetical protein